jgi:glutamate racemase
MKIGVFDSGIGGLSIVQAIESALPENEVIFANDTIHLPYGSKSPEEILVYVEPILQRLVDRGCVVIVIACNTVSTTLINVLRQRISVPLVAVEPMIKPAAAQTKTGVIAVCATPTTLKSPRYAWLKATYTQNMCVLEPDCSDWAEMIERRMVDKEKIHNRIEEVLRQKADVIVLGCTHYHWVEKEIKDIASDRVVVLQPEKAIIRELKRVIARLS